MRRRVLGIAALMLASLGAPAPAGAQPAGAQPPWPSRPVRLLVPYAPGGSTDGVARLYAEHLSRRLGQPVVIENRPGAATNIAAQALALAEANGYTVMLATNQLIINSVFGPVPPFDVLTGFAPVSVIAEIPFVVAVDARSPMKTIADFARAGGAQGPSISHAQFDPYVKLLSTALGVQVLGVPFQGGSPAAMAAIGGDVTGVLSAVSGVSGLAHGGKLRLLGVTSARRLAAFPDVATFAEQGFPTFAVTGWLVVLAPKGTPDAVLARLGEATSTVVRDPAFVERLRSAGAEPVETTAAEASARMKAERALWQGVAR